MATKPHNTYMPGYGQVKHHEWRTAENSTAFLIGPLKTLVTQTPTLRLLDVGAGPGTISASLAAYIPSGTVLASDLDEGVLTKAASHAKSAGVSNIEFQQASVYELPFPDESFEVVHAHQVLCHLDSPVEALKEMLRVCKPGGVVASRESDLRMWAFHPNSEGLQLAHQVMLEVMVANGGWADGGARLVGWALQAGVRREQVEASMGTWCYSTPEERAMWSGSFLDRIESAKKGNSGMFQKALQSGRITEKQLDEIAWAWKQWAAAEDGTFGCMHGEILIRK